MLKNIYIKLIVILLIIGTTENVHSQDDQITDEQITQAAENELEIDNRVPSHLIDVSARNGIVTLSGSTDHLLAKKRAEDIVLLVKGVKGVINQIDVKAPERTTQELKNDVQKALLNNPATQSYQLEVNAENSTVFLDGTVDSYQEKVLAKRVAMGVKGVKDVIEEIAINFGAERSDIEISAEIKQALRWDTRIDDGLIEVTVNDQKVTLDGTVGSATEKRQAEIDAWVAGVESVDVTSLDIDYWASNDDLRDSKYIDIADEDIKAAITKAYDYDPRITASNPEVIVNDGKVTLRGEVESLQSKRAAEEDARNIVGVWKVKNLLRVRPGELEEDNVLKERVIEMIKMDPYLDRHELDVRVFNGKATIKGTVGNFFEKRHAENVVSDVTGIIEVQNNLDVKEERILNTQRSVDPPPVTLKQQPHKPDWQINEDVKEEFFWSALIDENDVSIQVLDGHVEITGEVATQAERKAITENAYEGGARSVDNDVEVLYPEITEPMQ